MADTQINVGMNVDGVITGIEKAKRSLKDLGGAASDAGRSVGGMGDGGKQSADKVEQSTRSMINSIQRQIAATEAGDKSTRAYQESLARMRGIDAGALKPYLDQLDSAKSKAQLAGVANESFAASFAGIRNAAMIAAAAVGAFSVAFKKINDGVDALNDLKDATGASIENISALEDVALRSGASFDTVSTSLIKFNGILKDAKPGSDAANAMKALGLSVEDFKRLDPAEALRQTAVAMNSFADDGNKARLAQELFGKSLKDVAPFLKDLADKGKLVATVTTEQAEEAEKLNKEWSEMSKNALDLGRDMAGPMVTALNEVIKKFKEGRAAGQGFFSIGWQNYKDNIADFYGVKKSDSGASGSWDSGATGSWGEADKPSAPQLPDTAALKAAAAAAKSAAAEANRELKEQAKLLAELSGLTGSFSEDWGRLSTIYKNGKLSLEGLTKAQADLLSKQPAIKAAKDAEAKAVEAATKAYQESEKEHARYIESLSKGVEKFTADAKAQQDRNDRLGLSKEAIADLDAAELELQATKLDGLAIDELVSKHDEIAYQSLVDQAAMLRKLAVLKSQGATKEAGLDAAKKVNEEWKKGWEETDKIAREAFVGWAEGGIDMAEAIGKSLKKALLSAIYEATIRPIAFQIYSSATGAMGMGGGSTGGNLMSGFNTASSANSAYNMANGGYAAGYTNFATSSVGQSMGLGNAATEGFAYGAGADFAAAEVGGSAASTTALGTAVGEAIPYIGWFIAAVGILSQMGPTSARTLGSSKASYGADGELIGTEALDGLVHRPSDQVRADYAKELANPTPWQYDVGKRGPQESPNVVLERELASSLAFEKMSTGADVQAKNLAELYFNAAKTLDIKAAAASFSFASNTGQSGEHPNASFGVSIGGKSYNSGEAAFADPEVVKLSASRTILEALKASELPKYLSGVFDGLTTSTATQAQIDDTMKLATSYKTLHDQLQALPFEYLRDMSFAASKGLIAAAGTMENLGTLLGGYYEAFYTSEEKKAQLTKNTTAAFEKLGIVMPALDESARAWYRSEVDRLGSLDMSVAANATAYTSVLSLSGAMNTLVPSAQEAKKAVEDIAKAAADAAKAQLDKLTKNADDAYSALERAVSAQSKMLTITRDLASEQVTAVTSVFDTLKTNVEALYGQVGSTASMQAEQGNAFITQALSAAQSTGYLPDSTALTDAISAARSGVDSTIYASQQDADFARLVLAGKLSELKDIGGEQLTGAQKALVLAQGQVDALDGILTNAKLQLDAASGIDVSVRSVAASVSKLADSITALTAERASQGLETTKSAASVAASLDTSGVTVGHGSISSAVAAPSTYSFASVDSGMSALYSGPSSPALLQALRDTAIATGVSIGDIATKYGYSNYGLEQMFASAGIPAFAYGGYHAGGLAVVGEQGPELVNFSQPSQIYTASQTQSMMGGNTARLEALVEGLTAEVQRLQSIVQTGNGHVERSADTLDKVTEGGNAMRSEIMNKVTVA